MRAINYLLIELLKTSEEVLMNLSSFDLETGLRKIATKVTTDETNVDDIIPINTRSVINAARINCDTVQSSASSVANDNVPPPDFDARPRRGQYMCTLLPWTSHALK